MLIHPLYPW